jgi:hypothetical protein
LRRWRKSFDFIQHIDMLGIYDLFDSNQLC